MNPYTTKQGICMFSYNSRGFHEGNQSVCQELTLITGDKIPIICNQENFLLAANKYKIKQCLPNFRIYFKPLTKDSLNGRPKNGMFVAIPENLNAEVEDVPPPPPPLFTSPSDHLQNRTKTTVDLKYILSSRSKNLCA